MKNTTNTAQSIHFNNLADQWWDESGAFKVLHAMNPIRIKFIKDIVEKHHTKGSLRKLKVLDVGCGGGILCEPLARLGANVSGIDTSEQAIIVAKDHATTMNLDITYNHQEIESIKQKYDVVTCLEMLEHVEDVELTCKHLARVLKSGGVLIVSTLNKTMFSYLVGVIGAEYLTGLVPVGTHNWENFLEPATVIAHFEQQKLTPLLLKGLSYSVIQRTWDLSNSLEMNYLAAFQK